MGKVVIVGIPPMFGGGYVRVSGTRAWYLEEGQHQWEPVEMIGGTVQVLMRTEVDGTTTGMSGPMLPMDLPAG